MLRRRASDIDVPHMNSITSYKHTRILSPAFFLSPFRVRSFIPMQVRMYVSACVRALRYARARALACPRVGSTFAPVPARSRTTQCINGTGPGFLRILTVRHGKDCNSNK